MAEPMEDGSAVPLEDVVLAQAFEGGVLLPVLQWRGPHPRGEGV